MTPRERVTRVMSDPILRLADVEQVPTKDAGRPFGRLLVEAGLISQADLLHALQMQDTVDARLGDILVAQGRLTESDVLRTLSIQSQADRVDLRINPPEAQMAEALPMELCLKYELVPWRWVGNTLLVATAHPKRVRMLRESLIEDVPRMLPVVAPPAQIHTYQGALYGARLAQKAVTRVPEEQSARRWEARAADRSRFALGLLILMGLAAVFFPTTAFALVLGWSLLTLAMTAGLKTAAYFAQIANNMAGPARVDPVVAPFRLPRVSMIVPLYKEREIAGHLVQRLTRLTYPKSLLNVLLVLEAKDTVTQETLARTELPPWMSVLVVPDDGKITTKPRALNYALDFCQGSIVGVWDAEDAPEPDQIERVVARFNEAPDEVACLQGMLDYYNATRNWISRCFTIEYAMWWRLIMPGISRLGMAIPLGGTTLFFRRERLVELGGWDAHNVTEDADLGLRLARRGYRTELIHTVTQEEANFRAWPWVRQRSRWLKGFLVTYCVHMRDPRALLRDLGWRGFFGVQVVFLATFSQFAALPLLWTLWMPLMGLPHPMVEFLGLTGLIALGAFMLLAEVFNIIIGMTADDDVEHLCQ